MDTNECIDVTRTDIHAVRIKEVSKEEVVRLYCTSSRMGGKTEWNLQVRGPERLANGSRGTRFMVAGASLDAANLRALRAMIDQELADAVPTGAAPTSE